MNVKIPKGTKDVLPFDSYKWHFVEENVKKIAKIYNMREIRTPVFEHTELFLRGVGDTTDIVNKEMYTFDDKGGRSLTLKPEGTAGVARSYIENALSNVEPLPLKMYYETPVFRYERPQNGRLREHHQFGVEFYGSPSAEADFEVISVARDMLAACGITDVVVSINSIGCPNCRKNYNAALKDYLKSNLDDMCQTCRDRFEKNPLRILDCKEEGCKKITANAPKITDYICDECKEHFQALQSLLTAAEIPFVVDPQIVRGLDYYTKTVFEFVTETEEGKLTVCGGGRYDGLVEEVGGTHTPCVGFGMGIERLLMVAEKKGAYLGEKEVPLLFIATIGERAEKEAFSLVMKLRKAGISAEKDVMGRSLKGQMKFADKSGAKFVIVLGDNEIDADEAELKNMLNGEKKSVKLSKLTERFYNGK